MPSGFGGKAGFEMSMGHVFPRGVLAAVTHCWRWGWEVGGGAGDEGARARAWCEPVLLLCSVADTALCGVGEGPKVLEQKP